MIRSARIAIVLAGLAVFAGCGRNRPPVQTPPPPPDTSATAPAPAPVPPAPVLEPRPAPAEPRLPDDSIASASLDDLNRTSPMRPLFFAYDSSEITPEGRAILEANAAAMKQNPTWTVTIEGHCDERGTAEYNLALGERRAVTARDYLLSLGIRADHLRTVSYGKEFPFDPGQGEAAWAKNRRAHFVITAR